MAKIIGVHGVGHQFKGENMLRAEWLPALRDGLSRAGRQLASDADFICAFYGHLFRPGGKAAMDPPLKAQDVNGEWERELLELWWREASRVDRTVPRPEAHTKVYVPNIVQRALKALMQSNFFAGLAERALIYDLKQVHRYFCDSNLRQEARASIERVVGPDTQVIIAHSLGSVVAYEALCVHPEWPVTVFVTLGSPLGIRKLIFEALDPPPQSGKGIWPAGIKHWVNIVDSSDVVALEKDLSTLFGSQITNCLVNNGASAHDARRYLTTEELGHAVAIGL